MIEPGIDKLASSPLWSSFSVRIAPELSPPTHCVSKGQLPHGLTSVSTYGRHPLDWLLVLRLYSLEATRHTNCKILAK